MIERQLRLGILFRKFKFDKRVDTRCPALDTSNLDDAVIPD
jgi:hypothetical protein